MSGSGSPNPWTLVSPEEPETLRPLAEETEQPGKPPAPGLKTEEDPAGAASVLEPPVPEEQNQEVVEDEFLSKSGAVSDQSSSQDGQVKSEGAAEDPNMDSFSDSWSHTTLSPDDPSGPLVTPSPDEPLGSVVTPDESTQQAASRSPPDSEEGVPTEEEEAHESNLNEPSEPHAAAEEPELRRRRSLRATLERIGRAEEEDEAEEDFQLPPREEENWLTLNKCLLGAVLLVGLGTLFFSERDPMSAELTEAEVAGKQEWTDPIPGPPNMDAPELHHRISGEDEAVSLLQEQVTAQSEEVPPAEGVGEQQPPEEEESRRLKTTMEALSLLQKENERMRRELQEADTPTAQSTSSSSTSPSGGQSENGNKDTPSEEEVKGEEVEDRKREKHDKEGKEKPWKGRGEEDEEDWKDKERKRVHKEKERKERSNKERKERRGDDGEPWKERENKRDRKGRGEERKDEKPDEGSYHKSKDKQEKKRKGKDRGEKEWKDKREPKGWRRERE